MLTGHEWSLAAANARRCVRNRILQLVAKNQIEWSTDQVDTPPADTDDVISVNTIAQQQIFGRSGWDI